MREVLERFTRALKAIRKSKPKKPVGEQKTSLSRRRFLKRTGIALATLAGVGGTFAWLARRKRKVKPPKIIVMPIENYHPKIAKNLGFAVASVFNIDPEMTRKLSSKTFSIEVVPNLEEFAKGSKTFAPWFEGTKGLNAFTSVLQDRQTGEKIIKVTFDRTVFENRARAFGVTAHEFYNASKIEELVRKGVTRKARVLGERAAFRYSVGMLEKFIEETKNRIRENPQDQDARNFLRELERELQKERISLQSWIDTPTGP